MLHYTVGQVKSMEKRSNWNNFEGESTNQIETKGFSRRHVKMRCYLSDDSDSHYNHKINKKTHPFMAYASWVDKTAIYAKLAELDC